MGIPLRVLIVEDSEADVLLVIRELRRGGYEPSWERVDTAEAMSDALRRQPWDIVFSDYHMPLFNALEALKLLKDTGIDLPFIIVSGSIGETGAVTALKSGANDFVAKDNLARLVPAVNRELREAEVRRKRKRAEEALKDSEDRYRLHFENVSDVIYTIDRDFCVTTVSPSVERLLGYKPDEIVGRSIADLNIIPPEYLERAYTNTMRVLAGEQSGPTEYEFITKNGTRKFGEVTGAPVFKGGEIVAIISVARDVTAHRQLEAQLRQSQKLEAVGLRASGVAHDFNNLLTVILGRAQLGLMTLSPNSPLYENLSEIQMAAERAAKTTRQLLAFSRKQVLQPRIIQLNQVILEIDKILRRLIREDIALSTKLATDLWSVRADPGQLEQVLVNLVVNSRDAMAQGWRITIETANVELDDVYAQMHTGVKPGRYVMLAVSDTGCGITAEIQKRIFEPFFTTKPEGKGTGLGLSVVYGIVKQHGGNIWVYSAEGMGTTFRVYLPAANQADGEEQTVAEKPMPRGSETILVAEDEERLRKMTATVLSELGYTVWEASSGEQASTLIEQRDMPPDLLLTDVVMPGMNGLQLAQNFRQRFPEAKILFVSGYSEGIVDPPELLKIGADLLQKPFVPVTLAQKVRETLDK